MDLRFTAVKPTKPNLPIKPAKPNLVFPLFVTIGFIMCNVKDVVWPEERLRDFSNC